MAEAVFYEYDNDAHEGRQHSFSDCELLAVACCARSYVAEQPEADDAEGVAQFERKFDRIQAERAQEEYDQWIRGDR